MSKEYDLMRDAFDLWYAEKYPGNQLEALKVISEVAFCNAWIMAMERYSSVAYNKVSEIVKSELGRINE